MFSMQTLENDRKGTRLLFLSGIYSNLLRYTKNVELVFCWLSSYIGIHGNKPAEAAAKAVVTQDILRFKFLYTEFLTFRKQIYQ